MLTIDSKYLFIEARHLKTLALAIFLIYGGYAFIQEGIYEQKRNKKHEDWIPVIATITTDKRITRQYIDHVDNNVLTFGLSWSVATQTISLDYVLAISPNMDDIKRSMGRSSEKGSKLAIRVDPANPRRYAFVEPLDSYSDAITFGLGIICCVIGLVFLRMTFFQTIYDLVTIT